MLFKFLKFWIRFVSDLQHVGGFFQVLQFSLPKYNWNIIIESGVKHHNLLKFLVVFNSRGFIFILKLYLV